jgi:hypothetical protein
VDVLLTVLSTIAALFSGAVAFRVQGWCQITSREASKLNGMQARVIALEGAIEQLNAQHRKLSGKFFQSLQSRSQTSQESQTTEIVEPPFCANFGQAQLEGPRSKPAACECEYCVFRREQRDAMRKQLLPRKGPKREGET